MSTASVDYRDEVGILSLGKHLLVGKGMQGLRRSLEEEMARGRRHFLLAFQDVRKIDSAGVGGLGASISAVMARRGKIGFVGPYRDEVRKVLDLSGLSNLVRIFEDSEEAQQAIREASFEEYYGLGPEEAAEGPRSPS